MKMRHHVLFNLWTKYVVQKLKAVLYFIHNYCNSLSSYGSEKGLSFWCYPDVL